VKEVVLPLARTNAEAHLYMDVRPCECGDARFTRTSTVLRLPEGLASRYSGACAGCGRAREFTFLLPEEIFLPEGDQVRYGGAEPSQLLDAGEWLWIAEQHARVVPYSAHRRPEPEREQYLGHLNIAAGAMEEVIKFVPRGSRVVPESALWTERGRSVYAAEPGRFTLERLRADWREYAFQLRRLLDARSRSPQKPALSWPMAVNQDAPTEIDGMRFARVVDGLRPNGQPVVSEERGYVTKEGLRERIEEYLVAAPPLYQQNPQDEQELADPLRAFALRHDYRTDGEWIWPGAALHYLNEYGVAPEPAFRHSMSLQLYHMEPVNPHWLLRAREALRQWLAIAGERDPDMPVDETPV
jgi:hypothetical protein